jgi:PKD repeat protein
LKRRVTVAVFLIVLTTLSCSVRYAPYEVTGTFGFTGKSSQENMQNGNITLAEVIHQGISSINWSQDDQWQDRVCLTHFGQIFGKLPLSAYDRDIQTRVNIQNWVGALLGIRMAEIDGYTSSTVDGYTRQVLDNHPMAGYLPANYNGLYLVFYRNELNGYRYAQRLGYATSKWDARQACSQFENAFAHASDFVWTCSSSGLAVGDNRWYDGGAQTLGVFLKFYEDGISDAMTYADNAWNKINSYSWPGYYPYHLGDGMVECEIGFETIIGEYAEKKGGSIPYRDRLIQDIDYKLLADGWNSAMWSPGGYTICHANKNAERRMPNTLDAFHVLHSYYPQFSDTMKNSYIQLLTGSTPAWLGLTQTDLCDPANSYRFRMDSLNSWGDTSLTDTGTAVGDLLLFLEGIVPSTGSLAIPKLDEVYEDVCSAFSVQQFGFNYDTRTIRIPVDAGELKFQFGTTLVPYTFPATGVYQITFSNDWNGIVSVNGCGSVSVSGTKNGSPVAFEVWVDNEAHVIAGTAGYTFPSVTVGQHTVYGIYNATFLVQTVNVQESQATSVFFNFDQRGNFTYSPIPAIENLITTFDASDLAAMTENITDCTWDFGDGNITTTPNPIITHVYALHGIYNVTFTVESSADLANSTWMLVDVLRHDVAILDVAPYSSGVYEGYPANTNVTVVNLGNFAETATVDLYYNLTAGQLIGTKIVSLDSSESRTLTFVWNTTSVQNYHNYTITAVAEIGFDSNLTNNLLESSLNVEVKIPVDANGDRKVDVYDAIIMANAFGSHPGSARWNAVADANEDGIVDIYDAIMLVSNFGKTYS